MKKFKKIIIPVIIIVAIIILAFILLRPKNISLNQKNNLENLGAGEAKAQSYAASKTPSLNEEDMVFGDKDAGLKIFVYEDNSSLYSANLADTLDKLHAEMPSGLAIIVRPFAAGNSALAEETAIAIDCAQDKWTAMRALLFSKVKSSDLNAADFSQYAAEIGLDKDTFSVCLTNPEKSAKIKEMMAEAENYNVLGAPTMFIDGEMILGARPYEDYVDSNGDNIEGLKTVIGKRLK